MDKNQKLAIELFRAERIKWMENLPDDITVLSGVEGGEFSQVDILFDTDLTGGNVFKVRVDSEWFLAADGKLYEDYEKAYPFTKNKYKDKKLVKEYEHITNRAMECVAFVLQGRFSKVKT